MGKKRDECSAPPVVLKGQNVYVTDTTKEHFIVKRQGGGLRRVYGVVTICAQCGSEFFRRKQRTNEGRPAFCSHSCEKKGERNPMRRTGKRSAKQARATADKVCRRLVRTRGACEICHGTTLLQWAHGFSRRYLSVRWDLRNGFLLCSRCHYYYTHRPLEWDDWLREKWGSDLYEEMRTLARQTHTKVDIESVVDHLHSLEAELEAQRTGHVVRGFADRMEPPWDGTDDA